MYLSGKISQIEESFLNKLDSVVKNKISEGADVLRFNLGQPDFSCPDFVKKIIDEANDISGNNFYNHTAGLDKTREAIANLEKFLSGLEYAKEEIIVTNGAKEALFLSLAAIIDPGDEVIILAPYWPTYIEAAKFLGGVPVIVDAGRDFRPDMEAIRSAITDRTKAIILNSPNNPTGVVYTKDELLRISDVAIKNDLMVISDEVYGSTVFDGGEHISIAGLEGMKERTVVIDGFSKMLSMAGYRLGYAASSKDMIGAMTKVKSNVNGNTNSFFQVVLEKAIRENFEDIKDFIGYTKSEYLSRRDFLCGNLVDMGIDFTKPDGTFYVFAKVPEKADMKSDEFAQLLLERAGVAVAPGRFFGKSFDSYFRISFSASRQDLEEGMKRIGIFLNV